MTVVVRFDDVEQANAWVKSTSEPAMLKDISEQASLSKLPEFWLGEDVEDVSY